MNGSLASRVAASGSFGLVGGASRLLPLASVGAWPALKVAGVVAAETAFPSSVAEAWAPIVPLPSSCVMDVPPRLTVTLTLARPLPGIVPRFQDRFEMV